VARVTISGTVGMTFGFQTMAAGTTIATASRSEGGILLVSLEYFGLDGCFHIRCKSLKAQLQVKHKM
jgi:hypothetical protein